MRHKHRQNWTEIESQKHRHRENWTQIESQKKGQTNLAPAKITDAQKMDKNRQKIDKMDLKRITEMQCATAFLKKIYLFPQIIFLDLQ